MDDEPSIVEELREEENKGVLKTNNCKVNVDFFRLAVDNSADSVFLIDRKKMCFIDVNRTACESTGYSKDELLGMGPQHIKPEFSKRELASKFDSILKYDNSGVVETVHQRKDGSTFPVEVFLTCLQDDDVIVASVRDITKRKTSEEKYHQLFKGSRDGIVMVDSNGSILDANDSFCTMLGYTLQELKNIKNFYQITPEKWRDWEKEEIWEKRLLKKGYSGLYQKEYIDKNGRVFPVELQSYAVKDERGEIKYLWGTVRDISERKKAEEKASSLSRIVEQSSDGIVKTDKNFKIEYINPAAEELFGYTLDELKGKEPDIFNAEPPEKNDTQRIYDAVSSGETYLGESLNVRKDGSKFYCQYKVSPLKDNDGNITGYIASQRDITDQKEAERKICENEKELVDFFDNANDLIQSVGPDGSFNYVNKKWREVMGYSEDEVKTLHFTDILREDYVSHCSKLFKELSQGKSFDSVDVVFKTKNGEEIFVNGNLNSRVVDGEFVSTRGIFRDVTESKKREKQLSEARNIINRSSIVAFTWKNSEGWPVEYVSENVGNVFGYTSEDFLSGRIKFVNIIHPDDVDRVTKEVEDASRENDSSSFEHEPYRIITKNGSVKFVSDKSYIVRDKDGVLTHYKGLIEDVTEKQEMLNEIVKTKNKYTALVEQSNDGIIIVQDKEFKFANQALSKITGFTIDELTGMSFLDAVADSEKDKLRNRYKKRLSGEPVPSFYETKIKCSDGEIKPVELSASVLEYKGEPGILAFVRDISERKKFEEKVKESEKKYRETTELLPEIVFECDLEGKFSYANKVAFEKTGYSKEDIEKGLNVYDLIKDSELNRAKKNFKKIISDKKVVSDEFRITRKNGSDFYCMTYSSPILADGKVVGIRGVIVDISDRKKFENILKKSENKFKVFFNNSADAIFIHHPENFSILDVNEEACRRFGFTAEEMRKLTIDDISDDSMPALHSNTAKNLVEKLKEDETITMEWLSKNKSGETFWHEMKVKLININGDKRILATARDINKRKQADEKTERIMNAAADGMRIISKDFKVKEMNKTMEKLSGLETDKAIGMKCSEMFGSSKKCGTKECHMLKAMETGEKFQEEDIRKTKDGQKIPCLVMITPIKDSDGKISGIIEDFRDISEIKEKEKNLKEKLDELQRWKKVTVGREHKMKELKEKIKSLENK